MPGSPASPAQRRSSRQRGLLLLAALLGVACGEDVLVARFGLTSNAPDAGVVEAAAFDGGTSSKFNSQSFNAERARRARERRVERAEHDADH